MAYVTDPLIVQYRSFLSDLTTVEKRSIVGLTEIARDTLRTQPYLAPSLAQAITTRILEAPPQHKLPSLYLMDSIAKNIGEPFKSCFAATLPETYMNVWSYGGPTLHKALDKLLATWSGVFPQPVLDTIASGKSQRMATMQPVQYQAPVSGQLKPMMPDPRLSYGSGVPQSLHYEYPQPTTFSYPAPSTSYGPQATQQLSVPPDLVALLSSGILSQKVNAGRMESGKGRGRPPMATFNQDNIKEPNPDAIDRLLTISEQTKRNFLDRKFLKRQKLTSGQRSLRLWYVDLDTWMAGNVRQEVPAEVADPSRAPHAGAAIGPSLGEAGAVSASVTADEEQTHCALSGEKFEQYWDENHQEWRYKDAKRLTGEEAARYGLPEGALVLLSALGGQSSAFAKETDDKVQLKDEKEKCVTKENQKPSGEQLLLQVKSEEERPPKRVKADV